MEQYIDWKQWMPECVILANGDYPRHDIPLRLLSNAERLICCDGAASACLSYGLMPHTIVGDGDSLSADIGQRYAQLLHMETEQETNDLSKAFRHARSLGLIHMAIVGATGRREDHTLGNISLLMDYMQQEADVRMYTDYGVFIPCRGETKFACVDGQQVSLFQFGTGEINSKGLRYPLHQLTNWWQGTLNETTGREFTVSAACDYLVFLNYDAIV